MKSSYRYNFAYSCLFMLMLLFSNCNSKKRKDIEQNKDIEQIKTNDFYVLNFENELDNINSQIDTITINSIAKNIEIIPLEVTKESLLSDIKFTVAEMDGDYYVSSGVFNSSSGVIRFDKKGKFKEKLVEKGQGPIELPYLTHWSVNDSLNQISMFGGGRKVITYNIQDGEKKALLLEKDGSYPIFLNDSNYVACANIFPSTDNKIPYLAFFDKNGKIEHSLYYPENHNVGFEISENNTQGAIYESYGIFKDDKDNALFKDVFNDTIYRIKSISDISPYICIYRGKMTPLHKFATDANQQSTAIYIRRLIETKQHFFISYLYNKTKQTAIWDKETGKIIARNVATDQMSREYVRYSHVIRYRVPNGKIVLLDVVSSKNNTIYCMLRAEDAAEFIPDVDFDSNPLIIKIVL